MLYGVTFGDYHTFDTWGLYNQRQAMLSPPEAKTYSVDIPGGDGSVDLTETFGQVSYYDRELTFTLKGKKALTDWPVVYMDILNKLHGQTMEIRLDDDPGYYYEGRVSVGALTPLSNKAASIEVTAAVGPFKWENDEAEYAQIYSSGDIESSVQVEVTAGSNVSGQSWNVDYRYGTAEIPTFDWSVYQSIYIELTPSTKYPQHTIQFIDSSKNVYEVDYSSSDTSVSVTISDLESAGLDTSTIYRILITGSSAATVYVNTYNAVTLTVDGATRTTVPVIYISTGDITSVSFDGASYDLEEGYNQMEDIQLQSGENTFIFYGTFTSASISVTFRRGWL